MADKADLEMATVRVMVKPSTWKRLTARRVPSITYDDVIVGLLDDADEALAEDTR